ncbi:MAG: 3-isopropylmalate dehydratase small subunit [Kordiimonadaceae bacterium]|nr:3-isopropylmalate dehydratase small subunit [Kordiimonadaceae bacterium]MBO6567314.1 3-isopropylmalate dehydratase small subunit [Kordiimonadaceae bacterium]MBO6963472.1 3-isopropylmalate dehydratase small subunit [Kordiimonadaceae bacterium]
MEKFTRISAIAAPIVRENIDTDIIIPSREMKHVSKKGLSDGLFAGWRYSDMDARTPEPDFVLNDPAYLGTQILIVGENFGCGSSREHAVWALAEYGIRAIAAPSFSAIFRSNCIQNGVLPIAVDKTEIGRLAEQAVGGSNGIFTVDLLEQKILMPSGEKLTFDISQQDRQSLIDGLDPIDRTLQLSDQISAFEASRIGANPWVDLRVKP